MHIILVLWMVLIAGTAYAFEIRDVHGVLHDTSNRNVIVILGNTNCPAMDNMIRFQLAGLRQDYDDVMALAMFPCTNQITAEVKAWQQRVPHANLFCPVEIDARTIHPVLTEWQSMGYPQFAGMIFNGDKCITNWGFWRSRVQVEPILTRQLLDLKICVSNGVPCATWRKTKLPWQLEWSHRNNIHTAVLKLP